MDHLTSYFLSGTTLSGKNHHYRGFHDCTEHQFGQLVLQHVRCCNPKFADLGIPNSSNIWNIQHESPAEWAIRNLSSWQLSNSAFNLNSNPLPKTLDQHAASLAVLRECSTRHRRRTFQHNMKRKDENIADRCSGTRTASCGQSAWTSATPWRTCSQQFQWRSEHPRYTRPFLNHACAEYSINKHHRWNTHILFFVQLCIQRYPPSNNIICSWIPLNKIQHLKPQKTLILACLNVSCGSAGGRSPRTRNSADLSIPESQKPWIFFGYSTDATFISLIRPQHGTTWFDLPLFPHLARNEASSF